MLQHGHPGVVLERHIVERHIAANRAQRLARLVFIVFGGHGLDFADAVEAGERFAELGADGRHLNHRRRQQPDKEDVHEQIAKRHRPGQNRAAAHQNHDDPYGADDEAAECRDRGDPGQRLPHVLEESIHTFREYLILARFSGVGLDDADAPEGLREAAGDFCGDFSALAEQRSNALERQRHADGKQGQHDDADGGQAPVQIEQHAQRDDGGHQPARHLHNAGADEIADAVRVVHDARNQDAGLRLVEVANREPRDVRLHAGAHVGDGLLRRHAQHLRQREGSRRINQGGRPHGEGQRNQELAALMTDDLVDEVFCRGRRNQPCQPAHEHQDHSQGQPRSMGADKPLRLFPGVREICLSLLRVSQ